MSVALRTLLATACLMAVALRAGGEENGEGRRDLGEGRREKGEGAGGREQARVEKGEGRKEKEQDGAPAALNAEWRMQKEQGAGSEQQGGRSREQGAGGREQARVEKGEGTSDKGEGRKEKGESTTRPEEGDLGEGSPGVLPAVEGELSGNVTPTLLPGAPALRWKVAVSPGAGQTRVAVVTLDGAGTRVRVECRIDLLTRNGEWTIREASLDAAQWLGPVMTRVGGTAAEITGGGPVLLSGSGTLTAGVPTGTVDVAWGDGRLQSAKGGWTLEGVSLEAGVAFDAAKRRLEGTRPARLSIRNITTGRFGASNLSIVARLTPAGTLQVSSAEVDIAGGHVVAAPFAATVKPFAAQLDLTLSRIGLQDIAALVPEAVRSAFGRVDGEVRLQYSQEKGIEMGDGYFTLRSDEPAQVRLAPTPGLITSRLPDRVLKYYPGLGEVELGKVPIRADRLEIQFMPEGDAQGRTAVISLSGVPDDPEAQSPIHLNINVRGPLKPFIKLGTSARFSFGKQ